MIPWIVLTVSLRWRSEVGLIGLRKLKEGEVVVGGVVFDEAKFMRKPPKRQRVGKVQSRKQSGKASKSPSKINKQVSFTEEAIRYKKKSKSVKKVSNGRMMGQTKPIPKVKRKDSSNVEKKDKRSVSASKRDGSANRLKGREDRLGRTQQKSVSAKHIRTKKQDKTRNLSKSVEKKSFISHCKTPDKLKDRELLDARYAELFGFKTQPKQKKNVSITKTPKSKNKGKSMKYNGDDDELTFKPLLAKKSLQIAKRLGDVQSRLIKEQEKSEYELFEEQFQHEKQLRREATPKINKKSEYLDKKKNVDSTGERFEMLLKYKEIYSRNVDQLKAKKEAEDRLKEMAETERRSRTPSKVNKKNYFTTDVDIADRSSLWKNKKGEKIKKMKERKDEQELRDCTFSPNINRKRDNRLNKSINDTVYTSDFSKEGLFNHFNRLERARKGKNYTELGRSRSKSAKKVKTQNVRKKKPQPSEEETRDKEE